MIALGLLAMLFGCWGVLANIMGSPDPKSSRKIILSLLLLQLGTCMLVYASIKELKSSLENQELPEFEIQIIPRTPGFVPQELPQNDAGWGAEEFTHDRTQAWLNWAQCKESYAHQNSWHCLRYPYHRSEFA